MDVINPPSLLVRLVRRLRYYRWWLTGRRPNDEFGHYKRLRLREVGRQYGCATLVESGTFHGETVAFARKWFRKVISIELLPQLYEMNRRRFRSATNVRLFGGDSGNVLPEAIREIDGRALFWLDGHYSGPGTARAENSECPVVAELAAIRASGRFDDCILIDDARLFGVNPDYPKIDEVTKILRGINSNYEIRVEEDCIHALPVLRSK